MKHGLIFSIVIFLVTPLLTADELVQRVEELSNVVAPDVVKWRRDFHTHPELSNREERTSRVVAERLREIGVDGIKTGIAHHGVVALIKGNHPGPVVALRADMDALPITEQTGLPYASKNQGVMHACGHDAHTAILLGTAKVLTQMRDEIHGTVKLIFQPCEEGAPPGEKGGASLMTEEGALKDPDASAIFGLHVSPNVQVGYLEYCIGGALAAVDQFKIEVMGKGGHAAMPWDGVDPVVASSHIVIALQTILSRIVDTRETAVVTVGIINGGTRWNIIPDVVTLEGTVRTHDEKVRKLIRGKFERIVKNTAAAHGAEAKIEYNSYGSVTWNDPELTRRMLPTLGRAAGEDNVLEGLPVMGGEDFAYYAKQIPGLFFFLGVRNEDIGAVHMLHTSKLLLDENAFPIGVRAMTLLALDYLRAEALGEK